VQVILHPRFKAVFVKYAFNDTLLVGLAVVFQSHAALLLAY
jgi:hypothetical protein